MELVVYSAQLLAVVGVATLAAAAWRSSPPAARLAYWRAVGALCLMLPLLPVAPIDLPIGSLRFDRGAALAGGPMPDAARLGAAGADAILWVWAAGAAVALLRLCLGALRLRQLRRRSTPAVLGPEIEALRAALAPGAELRWSGQVAQPVAFGWRRPVVLLPPRLAALSAEAQRAVVSHELLHVARRDWLWIVAEEHVRAVLWFHPAVWWVLQRVQLCREQVVDRLVVARTASRGAYARALAAFAGGLPPAPVATAFSRRRHLTARLRQLSRKEPDMSRSRLVWTSIVSLVLLSGATVGIASALPFAGGGLEIRLAETEPAPGLEGAVVRDSGERIYLHPTAIATAADVAGVSLETEPVSIGIRFRAESAARMAEASREHRHRPVAIVFDGEVITAPTLRGVISDRARITGDFTWEEVLAMVAALKPEADAR